MFTVVFHYLLNNLTHIFTCCWYFPELMLFLVLCLQSLKGFESLFQSVSFPDTPLSLVNNITNVFQNLRVKCPYFQPKPLLSSRTRYPNAHSTSPFEFYKGISRFINIKKQTCALPKFLLFQSTLYQDNAQTSQIFMNESANTLV